ncbi:hypothetical protein [Lentzea sp. NEAU-D7]|nr:hypothetical protein [Lentzea sp. NEAU-D7]MCX2947416.1 hypothetical protein [Lentzea sp. NEAU-D7]
MNEIRIATVAGARAFDQRFDDQPSSFDEIGLGRLTGTAPGRSWGGLQVS